MRELLLITFCSAVVSIVSAQEFVTSYGNNYAAKENVVHYDNSTVVKKQKFVTNSVKVTKNNSIVYYDTKRSKKYEK